MRNKKKITQSDTKAINDFMYWHGEDTAKEMSALLIELQGLYFTRPGISLSEEGADEAVYRFKLLYQLVNEIQAVEKDS